MMLHEHSKWNSRTFKKQITINVHKCTSIPQSWMGKPEKNEGWSCPSNLLGEINIILTMVPLFTYHKQINLTELWFITNHQPERAGHLEIVTPILTIISNSDHNEVVLIDHNYVMCIYLSIYLPSYLSIYPSIHQFSTVSIPNMFPHHVPIMPHYFFRLID